MSQDELNAAIAEATGESRSLIAQRGFSLCSPDFIDGPRVRCDAPQTIDWDRGSGLRRTIRRRRRKSR